MRNYKWEIISEKEASVLKENEWIRVAILQDHFRFILCFLLIFSLPSFLAIYNEFELSN